MEPRIIKDHFYNKMKGVKKSCKEARAPMMVFRRIKSDQIASRIFMGSLYKIP